MPDTLRKFNGVAATARARDGRLCGQPHGLLGQVECHQSDSRAGGAEGIIGPLRTLDPSDAAIPAASRCRALEPVECRWRHPGVGLRDPLPDEPLEQLHVFPQRSGQRRPVPPARQRVLGGGEISRVFQVTCSARHGERDRRADPHRRHPGRPVQHHRPANTARRYWNDRVLEASAAFYYETGCAGPTGCATSVASGRRLLCRCPLRHTANSGRARDGIVNPKLGAVLGRGWIPSCT